MTFDLNALKEPITRILSAPGVDLTTISAKSVRKQLATYGSLGLTPEELKARRPEVDKLIADVYATVSQAATNGINDALKRKRDDQEGEGSTAADEQAEASEAGGNGADDQESKPVMKKEKRTVEQSDAEFARKLSSEINGRSRRTTSASPRKTKRKAMKSSETVDSEDDGNDGVVGKKKKRSGGGGGGGAKGGFAKQYTLSQPLSVVVEEERLSRPQVVKKLWEYIHKHELQNPSNKKEIMCDDALRAVFAVDKIDMFRMNKVLGQHLHEE